MALFAILVASYSVPTGIAELHGAHWLWMAEAEHLPMRILPLLTIATQLPAARIARFTAGADSPMDRIMTPMALIFGIVLYQQPNAPMLYWPTSNLLQYAQQSLLG